MKFIIHRTNDWDLGWTNEVPDTKCPGAIKEKLPKHSREKVVYTIEIKSLEELMKLREDLNEPLIIFNGNDYGFSLPVLEIYDGWRE
jgi:hypothetical protein